MVKSESPCDGKDLTVKNRELVGDRVNLRVGPGTKFEKVTYVNPNDSDQELVARLESGMRVLEQCVSGDWARVMVDRPARYKESHQGWVAREYFNKIFYTSDVIRLFHTIFSTKSSEFFLQISRNWDSKLGSFLLNSPLTISRCHNLHSLLRWQGTQFL